MPTDIEIVKYRDAGRAQTYGCVDPNTAVAQGYTIFTWFEKATADGMASTTTSETYSLAAVPFKARIKSIKFLVGATGITAHASNNAVITVSKRDSAAANKTTVATYTSDVAGGNVTVGVLKSLTLTDANIIVDANSSLTYEIAKGGTGVVVPAGRFLVELERV